MKNYMYDLGSKYLSEKILHHRYDLIYDFFFDPIRKEKIKILEIGLGTFADGTGNSRGVWGEYFPHAEIFVMDIDHDFEDSIGRVIRGDQSSKEDLISVGGICGDLDLIIDDGSHHPEHQLKSFDYLFRENLKKGGIYVIEDIECSYWNPKSKVYGYETGFLNIIDFFSRILHQINSEFSGQKNEYLISSITFSKNCIIIKKQTLEEIELDKREYRFFTQL